MQKIKKHAPLREPTLLSKNRTSNQPDPTHESSYVVRNRIKPKGYKICKTRDAFTSNWVSFACIRELDDLPSLPAADRSISQVGEETGPRLLTSSTSPGGHSQLCCSLQSGHMGAHAHNPTRGDNYSPHAPHPDLARTPQYQCLCPYQSVYYELGCPCLELAFWH